MADISDTTVESELKRVRRRDGLLGSDAVARYAYLLIGAIGITLVFWKLQFSTQSICCGDFDSYYHIRWSRLLWEGMRQGHFPPTFKWLPLTTLNPQDYVDHHLLFHILQIPFTWFGDLRMGAKIAATIFSSLAVFSCYWLIVRYRIRYTLVWLVALLACSAPFLYRLSMAKAPPLAIIFMVAGIYLLFERRYIWLAPLMFLFVWTYSLFPTLFGAALIWTVVIAWSERRFEWRPGVWSFVGMVAGFVVNPYFPKNIRLFFEHLIIKVTPGEFTTAVGQEWYPYESWYFLGSCIIAFAAMMVGYIAFNWEDKTRAAHSLFFMIFSTLLMIASFRSRRFVEYWPPFAVLFAAFSLQPVLDGVRASIGRLPSDVMDELQPFLDRHELTGTHEKERQREHWEAFEVGLVGICLGFVVSFIVRQFSVLYFTAQPSNTQHMNVRVLMVIIGAMVVYLLTTVIYAIWRSAGQMIAVLTISVLCLVLFLNVRESAKSIAEDAGPDHYRKGMEWIKANVPEGQMIFNTDWDDFPRMFYYDTTHTYVSGLDPTYLLDKNPDLSKLYVDITLGNEKDPAPIIRDRFGARYIFTDREEVHDKLYYNAKDSGWCDIVYDDEDCTVLYIRDQKGVPPEDVDEATDDDGGGDEQPEGGDEEQ
ncbi:MAG: hypothetical protein WCF57_16695 [Pyrinomonadaceae bacterium]